MDYLTQAKTFLHRAQVANDADEKMTHLNMAAEMLAKGVEELGQSRPMIGVSGLSRQEEDILALLQDRDSRPGQPVSVQSLLLAWGTGSENELFAAAKSLELKGVLTTDVAQTGYELTHAGYLRPKETAGELAAQVSNKASDLKARASAADAGQARVADAASEVRREVSHYGRAARRELSGRIGRYGMLLGATRVAAARNAQATPRRRRVASATDSEDAFIAKLRVTEPTDRSFIQDSAFATEDIVGDTEPATRGGELREGSEPESSLKARGRKRASNSE